MKGPRASTRAATVPRTGLVLLALVASALVSTPAASQPVKGSYIYTLSSFTGPVRHDFSRLAVDRARSEVYALYQNGIRVFNESGMEIYQFGEDLDLGLIADIAVDDRGDILLLVYRGSRAAIIRCNYRGEPQSEIALRGVPPEFADFAPNRMVFQRGTLYLVSTSGLKIVTADREGTVTKGYDLFRLFELEDKDRGSVDLGGFSVDRDGNILMTVPVLFRAYVLSPDGTIASFGKPGGAPGKFNIVGGIARDSQGHILVVDRLKGSLLAFDRTFDFLAQFASSGRKPGQLIFPDELAIDDRDRLYVTQAGKRGISVFTLTHAARTGR